MTHEEKGILVRIDAISSLIADQEEYLANLKNRKERLQLDLKAVRRGCK